MEVRRGLGRLGELSSLIRHIRVRALRRGVKWEVKRIMRNECKCEV